MKTREFVDALVYSLENEPEKWTYDRYWIYRGDIRIWNEFTFFFFDVFYKDEWIMGFWQLLAKWRICRATKKLIRKKRRSQREAARASLVEDLD